MRKKQSNNDYINPTNKPKQKVQKKHPHARTTPSPSTGTCTRCLRGWVCRMEVLAGRCAAELSPSPPAHSLHHRNCAAVVVVSELYQKQVVHQLQFFLSKMPPPLSGGGVTNPSFNSLSFSLDLRFYFFARLCVLHPHRPRPHAHTPYQLILRCFWPSQSSNNYIPRSLASRPYLVSTTHLSQTPFDFICNTAHTSSPSPPPHTVIPLNFLHPPPLPIPPVSLPSFFTQGSSGTQSIQGTVSKRNTLEICSK